MWGFVLFSLLISSTIWAHTYNLSQDWEYFASPQKVIEQDAPWKKINLPVRFTNMKEFENYRGFIIMRRLVPEEIILRLRQGEALSLKTSKISDVAELYLNEQRLGGFGQVDPYVPGLYRYFLLDIPASALKKNNNYFFLYLYSDGVRPLGIERDLFVVGPSHTIYNSHFYTEILQFSLLSIYLVVGLYHLLLAIRRRKDIYNLFFGLFSVLVSFYWFLFTGSRDLLFGDAQMLRTKIEYITVFHLPVTLFLFFGTLFRRPNSLIHKLFWGYLYIYIALVATLSVLVAFGPYPLMQRCLKIWQMSLFVDLIVGITFIGYESFKKNIDALYLSGGILILFSGALVDLLIALDVINMPRISQYTFLAFILGLAGVLANRFVRVHNEVEELNVSLEKKVQERTRELQQTLNEVKALKEQQDGDYFLMSLLINPLIASQAKMTFGHVEVKSLTRQKKQFSFRKWQREIGGDLNMVHEITLRGRKYLVVLNADAMGKSLQGASGSLVLGAVFLSMIERTHLSTSEKLKFPERWMKDVFVEMQKVFESFDGSMLVSLVLAVLDLQNGFFYYLNAEHPYPVLYRDGKASFLPHGVIFRKLGSQILHGKLQIDTVKLMPGDTIILGSDGRDDLVLGQSEDGEQIINEDEQLFLARVEEGQGDPEKIAEILPKYGQIYDDLSLLAVSFDPQHTLVGREREPSEEELEYLNRPVKSISDVEQKLGYLESKLREENPPALFYREAFKLYLRVGKQEEAKRMMQNYEELHPEDEDFLYQVSYLMHRTGDLSLAMDYGERLRLRNPYHEKNILNLAEIYRKAKNIGRSMAIIEEYLKIFPDSLVAKEALGKLQKKMASPA
ncbi:MAG: SpoIIE family protein phosphatase [Leptospiraceae bacterium]|nr:SpoIIE family protein phosphatase [Leptospiraceae bacterium]MDW8307333.1 SpoIIE family protein phosphatase [Leptospiraceae bacterium]